MPKYAASPDIVTLLTISLAGKRRTRQLTQTLREAIGYGRIAPGTRLPATRVLAAALGVARTTIVDVFEQLQAEGYLESRVGDGTYVATMLAPPRLSDPVLVQSPESGRQLSRRGTTIAATPVTATQRQDVRPFCTGVPALDSFPFDVWGRLVRQRLRHPDLALFSYADPAGYQPLREALAAYLTTARGVRCDANQLLIVAGSQQALDLVGRVLLDPGDAVWVETPGYVAGRGALATAGARPIAVPVDNEGIDVSAGLARDPHARLALVTPSHQYPLGVTMSLARRQALLAWAEHAGAWVLEDDYDSEYRYAGAPLPALQGLDRHQRVIYIGTCSKVLFPGLRLGYLVAPPDLVEALTRARALSDRCAPGVEQAVLTDFIAEGHFARHIRRTRKLYQERQAALLAAAERWLDGLLRLVPTDAGLHLVGWLPEGSDDVLIAGRARANGIEVAPLSAFALDAPLAPGLVLGYGATPTAEIEPAVQRLARALAG